MEVAALEALLVPANHIVVYEKVTAAFRTTLESPHFGPTSFSPSLNRITHVLRLPSGLAQLPLILHRCTVYSHSFRLYVTFVSRAMFFYYPVLEVWKVMNRVCLRAYTRVEQDTVPSA